jgi:hypothetical protein
VRTFALFTADVNAAILVDVAQEVGWKVRSVRCKATLLFTLIVELAHAAALRRIVVHSFATAAVAFRNTFSRTAATSLVVQPAWILITAAQTVYGDTAPAAALLGLVVAAVASTARLAQATAVPVLAVKQLRRCRRSETRQ